MEHFTHERVFDGVEVWPPELRPDASFHPVAEWDVVSAAQRAAARMRAPERVGASALVAGFAGRLWTALLVPAVRGGILIDPSQLRVCDHNGSVVLGLAHTWATTRPATPDATTAQALAVLSPLIERLAGSLALGLAWGNVAAGVATIPRLYGDAYLPYAQALLASEPLTDTLEVREGRVRRRSCCLFYLVPGSGLCGDCCHDRPPQPGNR